MLRRIGKKAQTTAEYAVLIALVIGAVVIMQVYVKRGIQGRVKDVVDHVGEGGTVGNVQFNFSGLQYEPYYANSNSTSSQNMGETQNLNEGGTFNIQSTAQSTMNKQATTGF